MNLQRKIEALLTIVAIMVLGSCAADPVVVPPPVNTSRLMEGTLSPTNAPTLVGIHTRTLADGCDYTDVEDDSGDISVVAVPVAGGTTVTGAVVDGAFEIEIEDGTVYQVFLVQDGLRCAELKHSTDDRPALLSGTENGNLGQLHNEDGDLRVEDGNDDDEDVDFDLNANDCDNDDLPDELDCDDDGDNSLDGDADEEDDLDLDECQEGAGCTLDTGCHSKVCNTETTLCELCTVDNCTGLFACSLEGECDQIEI